jgi:hypothetical protein
VTVFDDSSSVPSAQLVLATGRSFITPKAVDDMSDFQPFEGATNRTAVFVCRKSSKPFQYPVPYIVWRKKAPGRIEQDFTLDKVLQATERREIAAIPVDRQQPTSLLG